MVAIEFRAKIKNGVIEIPPKHRHQLTDEVRVIILSEERELESDMIEKLLNSPLRLKEFKPLSREEIYGRS
jgi:hypothetical protein